MEFLNFWNGFNVFQPSINTMEQHSYLPLFMEGKVVSGYGRGSKELGFPTANLEKEAFQSLPNDALGVYYGFAQVEDGPVEKMVMSIGWNPHYQNTEKSVEVHILKQFPNDFYGSHLKVIVVGFIRRMSSFENVEALIKEIENDIKIANTALANPANQQIKETPFWKQKIGPSK